MVHCSQARSASVLVSVSIGCRCMYTVDWSAAGQAGCRNYISAAVIVRAGLRLVGVARALVLPVAATAATAAAPASAAGSSLSSRVMAGADAVAPAGVSSAKAKSAAAVAAAGAALAARGVLCPLLLPPSAEAGRKLKLSANRGPVSPPTAAPAAAGPSSAATGVAWRGTAADAACCWLLAAAAAKAARAGTAVAVDPGGSCIAGLLPALAPGCCIMIGIMSGVVPSAAVSSPGCIRGNTMVACCCCCSALAAGPPHSWAPEVEGLAAMPAEACAMAACSCVAAATCTALSWCDSAAEEVPARRVEGCRVWCAAAAVPLRARLPAAWVGAAHGISDEGCPAGAAGYVMLHVWAPAPRAEAEAAALTCSATGWPAGHVTSRVVAAVALAVLAAGHARLHRQPAQTGLTLSSMQGA